jgi:MFS family permease
VAQHRPFQLQCPGRDQGAPITVSKTTAQDEAVTTTKTSRRAIYAMVALCSAVFVAALDQMMVYTLMKDLMTDLGIDVLRISQASWIITGYLLGYTVAMPLFGRLADVRGRRLMALIALSLFMVGSLICVFVRRLDFFVVARAIQAAGGGALVPIAMSAAADMFPLRRRAFVLGIVGGAAEAGTVLGPLYGPALALLPFSLGLIANKVYWPLIFMVNIPLSLVIGVACWWLLRGDISYAQVSGEPAPSDESSDDDGPTTKPGTRRWWQRGQVDYAGAALMGLVLACVTIGLGTGSQTVSSSGAEQASPINWPWLVGAAVALVLFVLYERKQDRPLIRLRFFKKPAFAAANIAHFLVGVALMIGMAGISLYAQTLFGLTEIGAGFLLIQLTLPIPMGAVFGGWIADRVGCKITAALGFLAAAAGYFLVSRWPVDPGFWTKMTSLVVAGLGFGFAVGPIYTSATSPVGQKWMATGSAWVTVSRLVGMAVGLSAISSWGVRRVSTLAARSLVTAVRTPGMSELEYQTKLQNAKVLDALHGVFSEFFLIAAVTIAVAVIPALLFYNHRARDVSRLPFLPH